jgi:hypothetical protein
MFPTEVKSPEMSALPLNDLPQIVLEVASALAVEALPDKAAVIVPALKFPEASLKTIVKAVFALVAFEVTVNVVGPDWLVVKDVDPEIPEPEVFRVMVPLPTEAEVMYEFESTDPSAFRNWLEVPPDLIKVPADSVPVIVAEAMVAFGAERVAVPKLKIFALTVGRVPESRTS